MMRGLVRLDMDNFIDLLFSKDEATQTLLIDRPMTREDLRRATGLCPATIAKLGKDATSPPTYCCGSAKLCSAILNISLK